MTTLRTPVRGTAESASADFAQCGKLSATSATQALGVSGTVPAPDDARGDQLGNAVVALGQGLHADWWQPNGASAAVTLARQQLAAGRYVEVAVGCNGNAVPEPPTASNARHWLDLYSDDNGFHCYQCWPSPPTYISVNLPAVIAADGSVGFPVVAIGRSGVNPIITQEIPMGGAFKPGTHEYHWVAVNPDNSVEHFWQNKDTGVIYPAESLGGTATDTPTCAWSSDGAIFCVQVRGTDGAIWQRTWKGSWGIWESTGAITKLLGGTGPPGPAGPPGPPGTLPPTATVTGTLQLS